jgi:hypothetical protein
MSAPRCAEVVTGCLTFRNSESGEGANSRNQRRCACICVTSIDRPRFRLACDRIPPILVPLPLIRRLPRPIVYESAVLRYIWVLVWCLSPLIAFGAPTHFDVAAQSAAKALLQLSEQAHVEVLFAFDDLEAVSSDGIVGTFEPEEALTRLLRDTGFHARRSTRGKFVVNRVAQPAGSIKGRILLADGSAGRDLRVAIAGS